MKRTLSKYIRMASIRDTSFKNSEMTGNENSMKKDFIIKTEQYAYTIDGRVIQIQRILENGKKYEGLDLNETGCTKVELDRSEIYGVAFGIGRAI